jgi:hypothetical protein
LGPNVSSMNIVCRTEGIRSRGLYVRRRLFDTHNRLQNGKPDTNKEEWIEAAPKLNLERFSNGFLVLRWRYGSKCLLRSRV